VRCVRRQGSAPRGATRARRGACAGAAGGAPIDECVKERARLRAGAGVEARVRPQHQGHVLMGRWGESSVRAWEGGREGVYSRDTGRGNTREGGGVPRRCRRCAWRRFGSSMDVLREQHGRSPLPYWKGGGSRVLLPWKEVQHLFCTSITPLLLTDNCQGRAVSGEGWPVIQHVGGTGEGAWPWKRSAIAQARLWAAARNRASGVTSKTASAHSVLATPCGMNVSITSAARACSAASSAASGRRPVPRHARASGARTAARRRSRPRAPPPCSVGRAAAAACPISTG